MILSVLRGRPTDGQSLHTYFIRRQAAREAADAAWAAADAAEAAAEENAGGGAAKSSTTTRLMGETNEDVKVPSKVGNTYTVPCTIPCTVPCTLQYRIIMVLIIHIISITVGNRVKMLHQKLIARNSKVVHFIIRHRF